MRAFIARAIGEQGSATDGVDGTEETSGRCCACSSGSPPPSSVPARLREQPVVRDPIVRMPGRRAPGSPSTCLGWRSSRAVTSTFTASVSGGVRGRSTVVTWSVQEGAGGGKIEPSGKYTAPDTEGTYHVVATGRVGVTDRASSTVTVQALKALGSDRRTVWKPGVSGGIPSRSTVCATIAASAHGNGAKDATAAIQAAIDDCPAGQVVLLSAGRFTINRGHFILIDKGITLRGAGPGRTTLQKTDGAKPGQEPVGPEPSPIVIIGPGRWQRDGPRAQTFTADLTADAVKGANSIVVGSTADFKPGQVVVLDELSGAVWQTDPAGRGQIWAAPDFRVVWQRHKPPQKYTDDPFPDALSWFSREDRPTSEIKQIDHLSGNTVFFNTPVHISYRTSHTAQIASFAYPFTQHAGSRT